MNRLHFVILMLIVGASLTGCGPTARFCHEVFVCDDPVAHGHAVVESVGGDEVVFANTGPLRNYTQRIVVYQGHDPLDEFTLQGIHDTIVRWYPEGSYRWESYSVDNKRTASGRFFVPYENGNEVYYGHRYGAVVIPGR